jgi:hypothetical protein
MDVTDGNIGGHVHAIVKETRHANKNYAFWLGLLLCTIYQSYRYPLQISSAGTSTTYSDTPLVWQAGKFVLALPLIAMSAARWLSNSVRISHWPIVLGTLFLSSFSLLKIVNGHDSQYLDASFWMFFSLVLVLSVDSVSASAIDKYFCILLAYAFGSTVVQVFLFLAFGRLPALAYEGSYLVRFGGFLDDPNGFAAIWFLLMGWSYKRFKGRTRALVLAGTVISLLLTQSWTALVFFLVMLFFYVLIRALRHPLSALLTICALPLCAIFLVQFITRLQEGILWEALQEKQSSIEGHIFPWALWVSKWTDWALLGEWNYNPYESWWASAMVNFGVLWFVAYLALVTALLVCLLRASSKASAESRPVYAGLFAFGLYFAVGSLNLPFPIIFPINALFFLFFFLVAFGKIGADDREPTRFRRLESAGVPLKASGE